MPSETAADASAALEGRGLTGQKTEIRAQTIVYQSDGYDLKVQTSDYDGHEIGETAGVTDHRDPEVLVELDGWISADQAIFVLKAIIAQIESDGLPQTTFVVSRQCAQMLKEVRNATEVINQTLPMLPPNLRERMTAYMDAQLGLTGKKGARS